MSHQSRGRAAKASGKQTEAVFDLSCEALERQGIIKWFPTYPQAVRTGKGLVFTEAAPPDRVIYLRGGRNLIVELKTVTGKNFGTIRDFKPKDKPAKRKVLRQLDFLQDFESFGILGCIIVRWKYKDAEDEWFLYWANDLVYGFESSSISVCRHKEKDGYSNGEQIFFSDDNILDWILIIEQRQGDNNE
jgi:hypothetical protein